MWKEIDLNAKYMFRAAQRNWLIYGFRIKAKQMSKTECSVLQFKVFNPPFMETEGFGNFRATVGINPFFI